MGREIVDRDRDHEAAVHRELFFLMFLVVLYQAGRERGWPISRWLIAFVASVVPFGTFMFDRSLQREIAEVTPSPGGLPRLD